MDDDDKGAVAVRSGEGVVADPPKTLTKDIPLEQPPRVLTSGVLLTKRGPTNRPL